MHLNMRTYVVGSTLLASAVVAYIYHGRGQFYPTAVYLVSSKGCLMVIGNMALVFTLLFGQLLIKMFLGSLREQELEHLNDRVSVTIMDTLLAMTIFREDFDLKFIAFFVLLLSSKIFHWIVQDRVDYISHTPALGRFAYIRVFSLMFSLFLFNLSFVYYAARLTLLRGPSVMLLFGFEYAVLLAVCLQSIIKFYLYLEDMRRDGRWESKGAYLLYLDFVTDMFKLTIYFIFFTTVMVYYGMPIHIIRQMYLTFNSFRARVVEVVQYRKATKNMNQRFPDATPEELARTDGVCIVCREEMTQGKKLPCGHILHFQCLRSWLERQQTCPTCRTSVLAENIPAQANNNNNNNNNAQQQQQQPNAQQQQQQQAQQPNIFPIPNPQDLPHIPPWFAPPFFPPPHIAAAMFPHLVRNANNVNGNNNNNNEGPNQPPVVVPTVNIGAQVAMGDVVQRVEMLQQHISVIQSELQLLHQVLTAQAAAPPPPTNNNNNNNNNNNDINNNNNISDNNASGSQSSDEEDALIDQALRESAQACEETLRKQLSSSNDSDSNNSNNNNSSSSSDSSASALTTGGDDDERNSVRQRRLARFSSPPHNNGHHQQ